MKALRPVTPVSILASRLSLLERRANEGGLSPEELGDELSLCRRLAGGMDPYVESLSTKPSPDLDSLDYQTRLVDWEREFSRGSTSLQLESEMVSGRLEGQFLRMLVEIVRPQRILEIGMFTGYSALAMAEGLSANGSILACEIDSFAAELARKCFDDSPVGDRIKIAVGPAEETLARLADESATFEFVFLDADKPGYSRYYDLIMDHGLLAEHGVLAVDNTLLQGEPFAREDMMSDNARAIDEFNRKVANDKRTEQVIVPLRDGVTLVRRLKDSAN